MILASLVCTDIVWLQCGGAIDVEGRVVWKSARVIGEPRYVFFKFSHNANHEALRITRRYEAAGIELKRGRHHGRLGGLWGRMGGKL